MRRAGFTLVEVVVALLILQVGIMGALGMLLLAQRDLARADAVERGAAAMESLLDSLERVVAPGAGARDAGVGRLSWSADARGGIVVELVRRRDGGRMELHGTWPAPPEAP